ncbi:MAG: hypothetical protein HY033_09280 [Ignavibacteriae bacterium]|nr:hypothetical protein [Ignavibacteriota bacterium]
MRSGIAVFIVRMSAVTAIGAVVTAVDSHTSVTALAGAYIAPPDFWLRVENSGLYRGYQKPYSSEGTILQ